MDAAALSVRSGREATVRSLWIAAALAAALGTGSATATPLDAAALSAVVADPARPEADRARDADRKPADLLAFAKVGPGQVVVDLLPGGGYFTRLFSKAVGPKGRIYAVLPESAAKADKPPPVTAVAANPAFGNVKVAFADFAKMALPERADVIWTSQNYHDLHLARMNVDVAAVDRAIFAALKPGGIFVVVDHAAAPGAPLDAAETLHRIDPAIVRREVEAAGFRFEGESRVLRNRSDDHAKKVFDPAIRGHTDQFAYRFRKPE